MALVLLSAMGMAGADVLARALKDTPTPVLTFFHTIGGLILIAFYMLIELAVRDSNLVTRFNSYTGRQVGICFAASLLDTIALLLGTMAF